MLRHSARELLFAVLSLTLLAVGIVVLSPQRVQQPSAGSANLPKVRLRRAYTLDRIIALHERMTSHFVLTSRAEMLAPVPNEMKIVSFFQGGKRYVRTELGDSLQERCYDEARDAGWVRDDGYTDDLTPADRQRMREDTVHSTRILDLLDRPDVEAKETGLRKLPDGSSALGIRIQPPIEALKSLFPAVGTSEPTDFYLETRTGRIVAIGYQSRRAIGSEPKETLRVFTSWFPGGTVLPFAYPRETVLYENGVAVERISNEKIDLDTPIPPARFQRPASADRFGASSVLPTRVSLALRRGRCLVTARLNGSMRTYRLVLDTGADNTVLSDAAAKGLRLQPGKTTTNYTGLGNFRGRGALLESLRVGTAEVRDLRVEAAEPDTFVRMSRDVGLPIDGLLGCDFLRAFQFTVDYGGLRGPVLTLDAPDAELPPSTQVPFTLSGGAPSVTAHIQAGPDLAMIIDTGAPNTWLPPRYLQHLPPHRHAPWGGFESGIDGSQLVWLSEMHLQGKASTRVVLQNQIAWSQPLPHSARPTGSLLVDDEEGLLGSDLLRYYRITFDYRRKWLSLSELPRPAVGRGDYVGLGIWLRREAMQARKRSAVVTIQHVMPFSPAAQAGVQVGDELVSIAGRAAARLGERPLAALAWKGREGAHVRLVIRRKAEAPQTIDLPYRRLF